MNELDKKSKQSHKVSSSTGMPPRLLIMLYLFLSALPLLFAAFQDLPFRSFSNELASLFGLVGFTWLLLSFLLSGRFRTISGKIGIDKTMRMHQLMAMALGLLILLHPFFYTLSINKTLPWDASRQFSLLLTVPGFISGMVAWILLPVLILTAIFRDQLSWRYESWRLLHGIGAMVVVAASLYHVLEVGRYSEDTIMKVLWFGLLSIAMLTLLRSYWVMPTLQKRRPYKVQSVVPASLKTWHITVTPEKERLTDFKAGQFAWLKLQNETFSLTEHPFSISSAPLDLPELRFTIKESGDFTNNIGKIVEGQQAFIDGPHGHFIIEDREYEGCEDCEGIVMIAGGIGVAPMISIIKEMAHKKDSRPVRLIYGNRIESQIAFRDELDQASKEIKLEVDYVLSQPPKEWEGLTGLLDSSIIQGALDMPNPQKWLYLLCGPPIMLDSAIDTLKSEGIPDKHIIYEKFSYL